MGDQRSGERSGKGDMEAERVNRQQLLEGKAFQKQRIHWHSLLLLLLSLNSWRKCLIKIFVLLCLSEMTYDSSLSQTPNPHSICHSHLLETVTPRPKIERRGGGGVRHQRTADSRCSLSHRPRLPVKGTPLLEGEASPPPAPDVSSPPSSPRPGAGDNTQIFPRPRRWPARISPLTHYLAKLFGKLQLLI